MSPAMEKTWNGGGGISKLVLCNGVYFILPPINVYDNLNNLLSQASAKIVSLV